MSELINTTVATQLKKARSEKGWSLDVASQHCGVSKAMLGQIERGESSPTIAKLWKIATGFSLPLSVFLGYENELDANIKGSVENQTIGIETIFEYDKATGIEVFEVYLDIGHEQQSEPHLKGVIEHIMVISGCMQYKTGDQWKTLNMGEKAKFNADQNHAYRNVGSTPLRFFNIIYYPKTI